MKINKGVSAKMVYRVNLVKVTGQNAHVRRYPIEWKYVIVSRRSTGYIHQTHTVYEYMLT